MRRFSYLILTLALFPLPTTAGGVLGPAQVIDGDTIEIVGERIRLSGIDAMERDQPPGSNNRLSGEAVKQALENIVSLGLVACQWEERDRYGRALAWCHMWNPKGEEPAESINEALVRSGLAAAYLKYDDSLVPAMHEAMEECAGMWAELPWCWRHR